MNYPNYDSKVVERYQTKLVGWTYSEFRSPFDIHTIDDVRILLEALQCGRCCWVRMSKSNMNHHRDEVKKRIAAGETVGKPRQPRSDKGTKRPRKRTPGAGEGGDEDGASPAKKQRKSKAVPKPRASGKKAAKKSKKQQLPPARPISNEFIPSDTDDEAED